MYIVEPEVEPHPNLIRKFELESNLILAEPELEPEPCDIAFSSQEIGSTKASNSYTFRAVFPDLKQS
jgi:hypothetical protein